MSVIAGQCVDVGRLIGSVYAIDSSHGGGRAWSVGKRGEDKHLNQVQPDIACGVRSAIEAV
jgi:hypothetical protein